MAQRRKVIPVTLTDGQREKLERLWFVFGNHGPQMTKGNHSFIQGLLEHGIDTRPLKQRGYMPTAECERAVDQILSGTEESVGEDSGAAEVRRFKLISTPALQDTLKLSPGKDSELKELIKSLRERGGRGDVKTESEGEIPPAA